MLLFRLSKPYSDRAFFFTFWDRGPGGRGGEAPLCNFKTVNAMVTKLRQDDADNNSSDFRCFVGIVT